MILFDSY